MFKGILVKMGIPLACALSVAFAPMGVSAGPYYGNNCATNCCDPCQQDPCCQKSSWLSTAAIFVGAAAIGAVAGVVAANSNKKRGKRGFQGEQGAGFTIAVVPAGQPDAGEAITSLKFCFHTLAPLTPGLPPGTSFQTYVTTPDGRTFLGTTFSGLALSTGEVTINNGPFFVGQYNIGVIAPAGAQIAAGGLLSGEICQINGVAVVDLTDAGIVFAATTLLEKEIYSAQLPFPTP